MEDTFNDNESLKSQSSSLIDEIVDVDFEFFDPKSSDFHGIKSLISQTFAQDAELIQISQFTDLTIEQSTIGSCVKVDGSEDDPYAFMSIVNLTHHAEQECTQQFKQYLTERISLGTHSISHQSKEDLLNILNSKILQVGWLVNERLINMPTEISAPMLKMLLEEIGWAVLDV